MKSLKKILIGIMFGQILILSNCTKPNHDEPPPPSGTCNLSIAPNSALIDLSKPDTPTEQVFVVSGDNSERAEWSLDNTGCAGIEGNPNQRTSVKVTANQSVTEQCTAEIFAKTSSDCFAKAVLTVIPKKISLACVSIIQSAEKITSGSSATFTATDGSSNGQPIADSVQWSTIDTVNCSDTKIQSPNNTITDITGVNKTTGDCVVTVQVERPSIPNCKAQTALTIEAPQNPTCNLDHIGPDDPITIENGDNKTLTAYTSGNNPTPVDWSVSNQEGQCKGTITGESTNVSSAQITGTNDGNSLCTITVEAKEDSTQSCQAKTKVITIKPKSTPTDCLVIDSDTAQDNIHTRDTVTFSVHDGSEVTWQRSGYEQECYCNINKPASGQSANQAEIYFSADRDNCNVSFTATKVKDPNCKKTITINVKKDLGDSINITADQKNLTTTAGFNIPTCGTEVAKQSCLKISVTNTNRSKDVYLGFPTFFTDTGALHVQDFPQTSACFLQKDLKSPAGSTKLPAGRTCNFFVYLQSGQAQSSENTTLTLPYVTSDPPHVPVNVPIQTGQMMQTISYTITPATVGALCIKINSPNVLTKQNFIDNPIQLVPNINKTFQFSDDISQPACIDQVPTGDYTIIAPTVSIFPDTYSPNTQIQAVTISTDNKEEISLQYSKDPQPDPNTGLLCVSIQAEGLKVDDLQSVDLFTIRPHVSGFVFLTTPQNDLYKACLRVLDTNYNIVAKPFCIPTKNQCYEPRQDTQWSQTIPVLPGTADNTIAFTYTERSPPQEYFSNWSIYGNDASDQLLWQIGNFYGPKGVQDTWNKEGLSDAFKDMDPTAWDTLMKDMKGDFRKSLPNVVSYSYFDRARANKVNANCTYIQKGSWAAVGAKCNMVYQGVHQEQQCYIKFQPNAAPKFCMGSDFNESQFKCGISDNLWSSKGCFLSQSSERQPADDWCMLDPRGANLFWCRNWYPETIDLRSIKDLKLYQANPNLEKGTAFACAAPGVKLIEETKWGGIGIGKDILRYDPSVALNDIRYTSVAGENLDPVFMYKNPFSDKQFTKQAPIHGLGNFDPDDTKFVNAFLNLCDRNQDFCIPKINNPNKDPQLALAHIFGRSGPMVNSAYAKYVKAHAKGYYSWQYDDGDALHQCNLSDTKLVVYMCGDSDAGDTTLKSRYNDANINELFGAAMQNQGIKSSRLMVVNNCSETIWIQQTLRPEVGGDPAITENTKNYLVELPVRTNGASYSPVDVASVAVYETPDEGLQSFRIWAKQGCKNTNTKTTPYYAYNCKVGNTGPNDDPDNKGLYIQPDAQTIFEATFGCFATDKTQCHKTQNGNTLDPGIWYDISTVDGFTLKASVQAVIVQTGKEHPKCLDIATPTFSVDECPTNVDLSTTPGM